MPIDINNLNPGVRFGFPDDDSEEWVSIRRLTQEALSRIGEETEKNHVEYRQPLNEKGKVNQRVPPQRVEWTEIIESKKKEEMLWDYSIEDWNLFDLEGKSVPCTLENKVKLMRESGSFPIFWADKIEILNETEPAHEKALEKNS